MAYFVVGRALKVTKPMTDAKVLRVARWIGRYNVFACIVAYCLIAYFILFSEHKGPIQESIDYLFSARPMIGLLVSTCSKWLYTTVAGVDFMLEEICSQREFDVVQQRESVVGVRGNNNILALKKERKSRLDELCLLLRPSIRKRPAAELGPITGDYL